MCAISADSVGKCVTFQSFNAVNSAFCDFFMNFRSFNDIQKSSRIFKLSKIISKNILFWILNTHFEYFLSIIVFTSIYKILKYKSNGLYFLIVIMIFQSLGTNGGNAGGKVDFLINL